MAKFRERCVIFLLVVSVLTVLAVLYANPQLYSREEGTSQDRHGNSEVYSFSQTFYVEPFTKPYKMFFSISVICISDMPGIETFSNLKRSKVKWEMIYPSDKKGLLVHTEDRGPSDINEDSDNDEDGLDDGEDSFVVTKEWIDNILGTFDRPKDDNHIELSDNLLHPEHYDAEQLKESVPTDPIAEDKETLQTAPPQHPPNMTIILTESRSGSTWLLEVLALPVNTMQFFEPLNGKLHAHFLEFYGNEETPEVWVKNRQFKLSQICTCNLSTQLGSMSGWQRNYKNGYKGIRMPQVVDLCLSREMRVAKTIRMYNISELAVLPSMGCANFKVVHLVRDPRAVMLSRIETFHELYDGNHKLGPKLSGSQRDFDEDYMRKAARDYCMNQLYNHRVGSTPPSWLDYHLIKYEELALTPLESVKSIYKFIHQPFTEELSDFVFESSNGKGGRGGYATRKNSRSVASSWKGRLMWKHVEVVQDECREFMEVMEYKEISKTSYSLLS